MEISFKNFYPDELDYFLHECHVLKAYYYVNLNQHSNHRCYYLICVEKYVILSLALVRFNNYNVELCCLNFCF